MAIAAKCKIWMEKGLAGGNVGLSMGLPRLQRYMPGVQQSTYYLVGGEPGTGKSGFTDQSFIYHPYEQLKQHTQDPDHASYGQPISRKLKIFKESLEIEVRAMIVKAACWRLYTKYNILTDINVVLSRGENRCPQELYDLVWDELDYFDEMEDCVEISDNSNNPTGINKKVLAWLHQNGTAHKKTVNNGDEKGNFEVFSHYEPSEPDRTVLVMVDHVGLVRGEKDLRQKKDIIEKLSSEYFLSLRNNYGVSPVMVSQLNRSLSSSDRARIERVKPQLSDFKDSAGPQEDANVIIALFAPHRYGIPQYGANNGYDITKLRNRFISLSLLKNRDGEADKMLGLKFLGECGYFEEMPTEADMKAPGAYEKVLAN